MFLSHISFCLSAGKFGALFASIPFTIFAAVYCVLFGLVGQLHSPLISHKIINTCYIYLNTSFFGVLRYSFCWTLFPTIHKHELPEKPLHHRRVSLLRTIDPRVLQRLRREGIAWSSSHQCWLVQWFLEHNLLFFTDGGSDDRSVLGQYFGLQREC